MVSYELDGQVEREYRPEGLRCRIRFGLSPGDAATLSEARGNTAAPARDDPRTQPPRVADSGAPARADGQAADGEHSRVLVVEDNSMLAMTLCDELEEAGFTVVGPAGSLARAMALSEGSEIDAAVLDVDLDGTAVYPLARRLRDEHVPFVLVTGYETADLPLDLRDAAMLRKPVEVERIRAFLEQSLRLV
jgi:CheY-like chemotaxis protein